VSGVSCRPDAWVEELLKLEPVVAALAASRDAGVPEEQIRKFCDWAAEEGQMNSRSRFLGGG
jgi:hypothetical protein